jgi:triphosphoribosyl-dephospho-CoA synthase
VTRAQVEATPVRLATAADVAAAAQLACLLEASAPKPGNVSPGRHFADTRYEDFLASAAAIGQPLAGAGTRSVGATVRSAVESTRRWTNSNTNLGIVLLLTPLARAALGLAVAPASNPESQAASPEEECSASGLRAALRQVLDATTVEDARDVYAAIRLASPGGLGRVDSQDVASEPDVTLLAAMRLAAHRDGIAREYATAFEVTFETGAPALERARQDGLSWDDAVVETFLSVLASNPDTHVARRAGITAAEEVSARARQTLAAGGVRSAAGRRAIDEMDRGLRDARNLRNPGTTADLTTAAIFVELLRSKKLEVQGETQIALGSR